MGHMRPGGATRRDAPGPAGAPAWAWRLALGLALGALLALAGPTQADLLIEGATTDPQGGAWTSPAGSTHGRTVLLLAGSGFSKGTDRPADRVTIGGAECAFVDYLSTEAQLACEPPPAVEAEPDAGGFGDKASEILVHPGGGGEPVAVQWKYQYREHLCPRLFGVKPQGASPGQSILYWGDFRCSAAAASTPGGRPAASLWCASGSAASAVFGAAAGIRAPRRQRRRRPGRPRRWQPSAPQ